MTTPRPQTRPRPAGRPPSRPGLARGTHPRRVARGAAADRRSVAAPLPCLAVALLLLAAPAAAQPWGVWIPAPGAFGDWRWAPPVLDVAALPAGSPDGEARLVLTGPDAGLHCHLAGAWEACGSGGGVTDHGALTGLGDDDHPHYALDTDLTTHAGNASAHHPPTVDTDDQTATEVPYTPTTGAHWTDPDPTEVGGALDTLAARDVTEDDLTDNSLLDLSDVTAISGNNTTLATTSGDLTSGNCVEIDANGNLIDAGAGCGSGVGDVVGPSSATDHAIARFDGTTGKLLQDSSLVVSDSASNDAILRSTNSASGKIYLWPRATFDRGLSIGIGSFSTEIQSDQGIDMYPGASRRLILNGNGFGPSGTMGWLYYTTPSATQPTVLARADDTDTGLASGGYDDLRLTSGSVSGLGQTSTATTLYLKQVNSPSVATCTDTGDAALGGVTITPTTSVVYLTSADPDGCTVTVSETGAVSGQLLELELQTSAGGTVTLADAPGSVNLAGAWTPGPGDSLTLRYNATASEWRERARADL